MQGYDSGVFSAYFCDRTSKTVFYYLCIFPLAAVVNMTWGSSCAMISNDLIPQFSLALRASAPCCSLNVGVGWLVLVGVCVAFDITCYYNLTIGHSY